MWTHARTHTHSLTHARTTLPAQMQGASGGQAKAKKKKKGKSLRKKEKKSGGFVCGLSGRTRRDKCARQDTQTNSVCGGFTVNKACRRTILPPLAGERLQDWRRSRRETLQLIFFLSTVEARCEVATAQNNAELNRIRKKNKNKKINNKQ